jgi:HD-like signal output (HDOD) protein
MSPVRPCTKVRNRKISWMLYACSGLPKCTVKSLFAIHSPQHKRLFVDAWNRVAFKASVSTFVAKETRAVPADHALLGSLLSEIGTLAVLSAFKKGQLVPDKETFVSLCREYSKSLGVIMLKKWNVDEEYIRVIRGAGEWFVTDDKPFNLTDVINLGLYYSLKLRRAAKDLPPIITLSAYEKLAEPSNLLTPTGELEMVVNHTAEIRSLALTMFKVTGS